MGANQRVCGSSWCAATGWSGSALKGSQTCCSGCNSAAWRGYARAWRAVINGGTKHVCARCFMVCVCVDVFCMSERGGAGRTISFPGCVGKGCSITMTFGYFWIFRFWILLHDFGYFQQTFGYFLVLDTVLFLDFLDTLHFGYFWIRLL